MATETSTTVPSDEDTWNSYPTVLVTGKLIKTLPKPFTFDDVKAEANGLPECQAFTSNGQLFAGLYDVTTWNYEPTTISYLKLPLQPPIFQSEDEDNKDNTMERAEQQTEQQTVQLKAKPKDKSKMRRNVAPKILHYIYETENMSLMPKNIREAIIHNINTFTKWDFRLYTPEKIDLFLTKEFPQKYKETLNTLKNNNRKKEFINLLILSKYGGLYTDISIKLRNVINRMVQNPCSVFLSNNSIISMACNANDPLVEDLIKHYIDKVNDVTQRTVEQIIYNHQDVTVMK